jgi:hypothetical protein
MQKYSLFIVIVLLLLGVLAWLYYGPLATSDSSDTQWLTYTNTQYGYEFNYPANFPPTAESVPAGLISAAASTSPVQYFGVDFPQLATAGTNLTHLTMWVTVFKVTPAECVGVAYGNPIAAFGNLVSTSTSLLGGQLFTKVVGINDAGAGQFATTEYYATMHNNRCYRLMLAGRGFNDIVTHNQDHPEQVVRPYDLVPLDMIFRQIAERFKFIN